MVNTDGEGRELRAGDGTRLVLGALIKSGGAGSVYRVRDKPDVVAKLYHDDVDLPLYERKVTAMLALTPQLPDLSEGGKRYVQIAWPKALLRDARNRFVGYTMPAVDVAATSELECVLQEKQASRLGLPTGLGAKITLAANLSNVIAELHKQRHRVVDLKPVNLRFYPSSLYMAMLDCDGFSIQGQNERFEAPQFTVDYLAPEFQRGGLTAIGEEQQDRFALAVIVFQLLNFGIHPYTGRPLAERIPTDIPGRIAEKLYAYGRHANAKLAPNPGSGHESMPADLRDLFDRAFEGPGAARPSPLEWGAALRPYAQRASLRLVSCKVVSTHQHFAGLACGACVRAGFLKQTAKNSGQSVPVAAPPGRAGAARTGTGGSAGVRSGFGWRKPVKPPLAGGWRKQVNLGPKPASYTSPPPLYSSSPPSPPPPPRWPQVQQIAYPAWANTGTQRWFYRQYYNATPWQIVKFIFWSALIGIVLITNVAEEVSRRMRESRNDAFVPPAQVIATPATPAPSAPASAPFAPPPVDFISPAFSGPPTIPQIVEARAGVVRVAQGISENNRQLVDAGMTELMRAVPEERRKHASHLRAGYHNRFRDFLSRMLPASSAQRRDERHSLASQLQTDAYDAEAACEWSWLAMADNELDHARNGFLRAIWADPQYSCGWLGYGTVASNDTGMSFGSLVMAERLELGNADEYAQRDQFVESTFMPESRQLERWRIMDARARVQAALSRNASAPPEIEKRAEKTLPRL